MKIVKRDKFGQVIESPQVLEPVEDLPALIERFYRLVGRSLKDLESAEVLESKEINALVNLGKLLPQLEQAELTRQTKINKKNVKDLGTDELRALAAKYLKQPSASSVPSQKLLAEESEDE